MRSLLVILFLAGCSVPINYEPKPVEYSEEMGCYETNNPLTKTIRAVLLPVSLTTQVAVMFSKMGTGKKSEKIKICS